MWAVEIQINDNWYVMYTAETETAEMKYIGAGERKRWSTILRNGYYPEKPVPEGAYRLVREVDTDWSAGVTYYAVVEFEIE